MRNNKDLRNIKKTIHKSINMKYIKMRIQIIQYLGSNILQLGSRFLYSFIQEYFLILFSIWSPRDQYTLFL